MDDSHPLRRWRHDHKVTLTTLGADVGVGPSHLSEIERGANRMSVDLALKLSKKTGIPVEKLAAQPEAAQ